MTAFSRTRAPRARRGAALGCGQVIGTDAGNVILVDMAANERRRWPAHRGRVNDVRVDIAGQNIASCSEDGHVIISGFSGDPVVYDHHRPVLTVALDPQFAAKTFKRPFACGGVSGKFVVIRKAPIFGLSDRVVSEGEGAVRALAWRGNLIAWANDAGVKVYDAEREVRITYIAKPDGAVAPAACPPRLAWEDDATLLIGWYDVVKVRVCVCVVCVCRRRRPAPTRCASVRWLCVFAVCICVRAWAWEFPDVRACLRTRDTSARLRARVPDRAHYRDRVRNRGARRHALRDRRL